MRKTIAALVACIGLSVATTGTARAESDFYIDNTEAVAACIDNRVTCVDLAERLAHTVTGRHTDRGTTIDAALASRLGAAATRVLRHPDGDLRLKASIDKCRAGKSAVCGEIDFLLEHVAAGEQNLLDKAGKGDMGRQLGAMLQDALDDDVMLSSAN